MFQWSQPYYATNPVWGGKHFGNTGVCLGITIPNGGGGGGGGGREELHARDEY